MEINNYIFIDIDYPYDLFMKFNAKWYKEYAKTVLQMWGFTIADIRISESASGYVHVFIHVKEQEKWAQLPPKQKLYIMYSLGCDLGLVSISMLRLKWFGDPQITVFSTKRKKNHKAK